MELTFEEREQKVLESIGKIFEVFDGMTQDYVKLIREHHKVVTAGLNLLYQVVKQQLACILMNT